MRFQIVVAVLLASAPVMVASAWADNSQAGGSMPGYGIPPAPQGPYHSTGLPAGPVLDEQGFPPMGYNPQDEGDAESGKDKAKNETAPTAPPSGAPGASAATGPGQAPAMTSPGQRGAMPWMYGYGGAPTMQRGYPAPQPQQQPQPQARPQPAPQPQQQAQPQSAPQQPQQQAQPQPAPQQPQQRGGPGAQGWGSGPYGYSGYPGHDRRQMSQMRYCYNMYRTVRPNAGVGPDFWAKRGCPPPETAQGQQQQQGQQQPAAQAQQQAGAMPGTPRGGVGGYGMPPWMQGPYGSPMSGGQGQ